MLRGLEENKLKERFMKAYRSSTKLRKKIFVPLEILEVLLK